ncbi:MAG: hypothetical protein GTO18_04565 [Anaerolineales bacterium]|nr:hypothetical protein [Anaerolineales bacterium]
MRDRQSIAPYAYLVCVALLLIAGGWYIVNRQFDLIIQVSLILAVVSFAVGIYLDPDRVKNALKGRQARYGSNVMLLSLGFIGILVIMNFLIYENPQRWDLTEDKQNTLSPETLKVLEELPDGVYVQGFYSPTLANSEAQARILLTRYQIESQGNLEYEFIDPLENPFAAEEADVTRDGTIVVIMGDRSEHVDYATEQNLTEALVRLINPGERKVYFLVGHGERESEGNTEYDYSQVRRAMEVKNYEVEDLNLLARAEIPIDATVILVPDPQAPLSESEVELIEGYLDTGGSLVFLSEPTAAFLEEGAVDPLLEYVESEWGVILRNDFVVDFDSSMPLSGVSYTYGAHPITNELGNMVSFFPSSRSLETISLDSKVATSLVSTGENSYGETDYATFVEEGVVEFNEDRDTPGPMVLSVAGEDQSTSARVVIFGDADFASNVYFYDLGNGDLIINSIDWAAGNEQLINLTPKQSTQRFVFPPTLATFGLILLVTIIVIPGVFLLMGVSVWWQRRKRR